MVDEKMLHGIKESLKKIDTLKKQENIGELLAEYGVDIKSLDEKGLIEMIVKYLLTESEKLYYNQYNLYVKRQEMIEATKIVTALNELTANVDQLYEERREASTVILHINDIVRKIKLRMHDVPMVRISCLYGHLENDYQRYSKASIKAGMDESRMNDTIYNIEHGSFLLRQLKTKELERLKKELAAYKVKANSEIDERHERYVRTREEYTELLRSVVIELLRDDTFLNAALLSVNALYGEVVKTEIDAFGVLRVASSELKDISRAMIVDKFFLYFDEHNQEKYDANTFYKLLEEFMLYAYTANIRKLEGKKNKCLKDIHEAFDKQKGMMNNLAQCQTELVTGVSYSTDEEDTLSLVYKMSEK